MRPRTDTLLIIAGIGFAAWWLSRRGDQLLREAREDIANVSGTVSEIALAPVEVLAGGLSKPIERLVNQDNTFAGLEGSESFESAGGQLFRARVALFGLPDDFPEEARERNPGLFGRLFN